MKQRNTITLIIITIIIVIGLINSSKNDKLNESDNSPISSTIVCSPQTTVSQK